MVPVSFGHHASANTAAGVPRPFTSKAPPTLSGSRADKASSVGENTLSALRKEVAIFKRRQHLLQVLKVLLLDYLIILFLSYIVLPLKVVVSHY